MADLSTKALLDLDDEALYLEIGVRSLAAEHAANSIDSAAIGVESINIGPIHIPDLDPRHYIHRGRNLVAYWNGRLYKACCTDDATEADLRTQVSTVVNIAGEAAVETIAVALNTVGHVPDKIAKPIAAAVIHHTFGEGRKVACQVWSGFKLEVVPNPG